MRPRFTKTDYILNKIIDILTYIHNSLHFDVLLFGFRGRAGGSFNLETRIAFFYSTAAKQPDYSACQLRKNIPNTHGAPTAKGLGIALVHSHPLSRPPRIHMPSDATEARDFHHVFW